MPRKINRIKILLFTTLLSILSSILISSLIMEIISNGIDMVTLSISIIAPLIIAPCVIWYLVGLTVKIEHLEKEQRKLATYDMLTGLLVRRVFLSNVEALLNLAERSRGVLSFVYIDIDNFKNINDKFGHTCGDAVLASFAENLRNSMRKSDVVGRIGGEEFAVALPDTDIKRCIHVLEKISSLAKTAQVEAAGQKIVYTISIGVTVFNKSNRVGVEQLIEQADAALYHAKRSGKDCIVRYSERELLQVA